MRVRFYALFTILSIFSFAATAQNGTIAGKVVDVQSQEAIIGANVVIQGTSVGAATDLDGNFTISNVKPGTYAIVVSFVTYKTQTITDVVVESGKKTTLGISLAEDVAELEAVVVEAKREIATDVTLLSAIKEAKLVVSGISAEQITKLPDRDAAQIAQRVPGITIADNRFVVVRGIPQRYNQVMFNGSLGPSTETDSRSFSFDLIPAGFIDQMLIYKSGSAELPGDFSGGLIHIATKEPAAEDFTKVEVGVGFRQGTTFKDNIGPEGSSTDWLGYDNGFRDLPANFPSTQALQASDRSSSLRERTGRSLSNNFEPLTNNTPVDHGFKVTTSQTFKIGGRQAGVYASLSYSRSFQNFNAEFNRFEDFLGNVLTQRFVYQDISSNNEVRVGGMLNMDFKLNNNHRIEFRNFFVQLGEARNIVRGGTDFKQLTDKDRLHYAYYYLSRGILTSQLTGEHKLGAGNKVDWVIGINNIDKSEPDFRRFRTTRAKDLAGTEEPYEMILPPNSNPFDASRFYSSLNDRSINHGLNFEHRFGNMEKKQAPAIRAGYLVELREREFSARYLSYLAVDPSSAEIQSIIRDPLSDVFSQSNVNRNTGLTIEEGTNRSDSYTGANKLFAGYVSGTLPVSKFDLTGGLRVEHNIQTLESFSNLNPINVENVVTAFLPSLNAAFNLSDRSLVRVAYSRTLNRPEFRELAPFLFYQFELDANINGTSDLKTAFVDNVDVRWEMYPNPGESFSIGGFYKKFTDPIELYNQIVGESPQFFYANSPKATSFGAEVEVRKSLASLGVSKFLRNTSVNVNAAFIKSEVDVGAQATNQARFRPLTGQSPYIINTGLYYQDENGFSANIAYNVFGRRIFVVGDVLYPTWFEMPRNILDLQIAKEFKQRYEVKLNVQNLLDATYSFRQDSANDNKIQPGDPVMRAYNVGAQYSITFGVKFNR
jgi:outer membrane receptor for ferrienterochelin and colicin